MAELATTTAASVYNQVYHLQKPDYSRDVTDASKQAYVLVLLTSSQGTNTESRVLIEIWRELATRFGDVKFCQMRADLCIEGYPDKNTPTVLVYKDGDIKRQLVTLRDLGGVRTKAPGTSLYNYSLSALKCWTRDVWCKLNDRVHATHSRRWTRLEIVPLYFGSGPHSRWLDRSISEIWPQ